MRRRWTLGLGAAFLLVTGIVVAGWTAGLDAGVDGFVAAHRFARLTHFAQSVSSLGNTSVVLVILAIAGCYAAATGHRARIPALLVAPLLGFLTSSLVKVLVHHPRPPNPIITDPTSYGFPSGHAATASATWITFALLALRAESRPPVRRFLLGAAVGLALLIGWSRIYLGVHYLMDVLGGWLLGSAIAVALAGRDSALSARTPAP